MLKLAYQKNIYSRLTYNIILRFAQPVLRKLPPINETTVTAKRTIITPNTTEVPIIAVSAILYKRQKYSGRPHIRSTPYAPYPTNKTNKPRRVLYVVLKSRSSFFSGRL